MLTLRNGAKPFLQFLVSSETVCFLAALQNKLKKSEQVVPAVVFRVESMLMESSRYLKYVCNMFSAVQR